MARIDLTAPQGPGARAATSRDPATELRAMRALRALSERREEAMAAV